ncbi:hypothetical protein ACQUW5_13145 [Legionella sp. CNM-1927-20]|uniref:hypothetical protein n=1 Tax=Legionella sp. CNM-1927-20 TaxID=3422221 RepID=UPI00403AC05A
MMFKFKSDPLFFLDKYLKPALAATAYIFLAKQALKKDIYDESVEKRIQAYTEQEAISMDINPDELKKFMDYYCQLSRDIQTQLQNRSELCNYEFSSAEINALNDLQQKLPEFSKTRTLNEVQSLLFSNPDLSTKLLSWGRSIISETNNKIFKSIKDLSNRKAVLSTDTVLNVLNRICETTFPSININYYLTAEMAKAISACTRMELDSTKINNIK